MGGSIFEAGGILRPTFQASPWIDAGLGAPFIWIDRTSQGQVFAGESQAFVGHRMSEVDDPRPRGLFAEWTWDGKRLDARCDPLGFFPLFVYASGKTIGLSPSILQLFAQGANPELDRVALAVFHRVGFFVGNDTPFRHITVLPPGGHLTWIDGELSIKATQREQKLSELSREQAVEAFIEIPRAAIRRFLAAWEGPIVLPLSGGRDSRHILLEMAHQKRLPQTCLTFHHGGPFLNAEIKAARAISSAVGARHTVLGHPRMRLRDAVRGVLMTQLCADEHAQMMPMHDYLATSSAAALDGIGGDILTNPDNSAAEFLQRAHKGDYEGIAHSLFQGHARVIGRNPDGGGAGAIYSPDLAEAAKHRVATAIKAYDNLPDPYQSFWFWHRTRREITFTSTAILGGAPMVFAPYLDPDFVDLGLSLPWSVTGDQNLHNDAIARAYPQYAAVPFAEGFKSDPPGTLRFGRLANILDALRIALKVGSGSKLERLRSVLAESPLARGPSDIYRMHSEFIETMSVGTARNLIKIGQDLFQSAKKDSELVSDVYG
jgi:asparagine synthase (glutamine-hydrolysing)